MNKIFTLSIVSSLLSLILTGCGAAVTGSYSLNQVGSQFSNPACSQIILAINESSGQVTGQGSNSCFSENLIGTDSTSGVIQVSQLTVMSNPANQTQGNTSSGMCTYSGTLTVNGSSVSGTLNPSQTQSNYGGYGCSGSISINGTKN